MANVSEMNISEALVAVLRNHLKFISSDQEIPFEIDLSKLGLDSMNAISLLLEIEETFSIIIPDSLLTVDTFRTRASLEEAISNILL